MPFPKYNEKLDLKKQAFISFMKELELLKSQNNESSQQIQTLSSEINSYLDKIVQLNDENKKFKERINDFKELDDDESFYRQKIENIRQHINTLNSKIHDLDTNEFLPNVSLVCTYDKKINSIRATVKKIEDKFKRPSQKFVFGIAFSSKPLLSIHDADIIIQSESKKIPFPVEEGETYLFKLNQSPPNSLLNNGSYQIIHLVPNTLSQFLIL